MNFLTVFGEKWKEYMKLCRNVTGEMKFFRRLCGEDTNLTTTTISFICMTITKYYSIAKAT